MEAIVDNTFAMTDYLEELVSLDHKKVLFSIINQLPGERSPRFSTGPRILNEAVHQPWVLVYSRKVI